MDNKKFWKSKTLWANLVGLITIIVQSQTSYVINPAIQAEILIIINLILRAITKDKIEW